MTNNNNLTPPIEEVKYIEETQLPMLSEITDKNGKVILPSELVSKLRDPNAKFRADLAASCYSCGNTNLTFKLEIYLLNCMGGWKSMKVYNTDSARSEANKIIAESGHWEDGFLNCFSRGDRRNLVNKINSKISWHEKGNSVDETVCNKEMPDVEGVFKAWLESELDNLASEPYPGERSSRSGFLD